MKVKTLIEKLQKFDPKLPVFINCDYQDLKSDFTIKIEDGPEDYPEDWNMPKKWLEFHMQH